MKVFHVYILASRKRGTLYIGMTSDLASRMEQHRNGTFDGFTKAHSVKKLVHVEEFPTALEAIRREKALKRWNRQWKIELIEKDNPEWFDLYDRMNR